MKSASMNGHGVMVIKVNVQTAVFICGRMVCSVALIVALLYATHALIIVSQIRDGINIWFGGTSYKIPNEYKNFKNNCFVFESQILPGLLSKIISHFPFLSPLTMCREITLLPSEEKCLFIFLMEVSSSGICLMILQVVQPQDMHCCTSQQLYASAMFMLV